MAQSRSFDRILGGSVTSSGVIEITTGGTLAMTRITEDSACVEGDSIVVILSILN